VFSGKHDRMLQALFEQHIAITAQCVGATEDLFHNLPCAKEYLKKVVALEHENDRVAGRVHGLIDNAFDTRIEKSDLEKIISFLDDITDHLKEAALTAEVCPPEKSREEAFRFFSILGKMVEKVRLVIVEMRRPELRRIQPLVLEIKQLEEDGDSLRFDARRTIFNEGLGAKDIIQWNEIFHALERATDACQRVADVACSVARSV